MVKSLLLYFINFILYKAIILKAVKINTPLNLTISSWIKEIGKNGTAIFKAVDKKISSDTKRTANLKKTIVGPNGKNYTVSCGPWKNENDFYFFCDFTASNPKGVYSFNFSDKFNYSGYEIYLTYSKLINITKLETFKTDLYSDPQIINVNDNNETYELKFKIRTYNQEKLYLSKLYNEPLDCKRINNELNCTIKKTTLECYSYKSFLTSLKSIPIIYINEKGSEESLLLTAHITVNFDVQKIDKYVKIKKLLTNYVEINNYIAYETNVNDIPSIMGSNFKLLFIGEKDINLTCILKKGDVGPLLVLCKAVNEEVLSLKEIKSTITLSDINIKYNFIIQPVNNKEKVNIIKQNKTYPVIESIYPNILNFTENDTFEIDIYIVNAKQIDRITFNEEDLECINLNNIKRCNISKEHFKEKKNGYYYIKYYNLNFNKKTASYYTNPINIILTKESNTESNSKSKSKDKLIKLIISLLLSTIILTIITLLLIALVFKRKKNSILKEEILDTPSMELETK